MSKTVGKAEAGDGQCHRWTPGNDHRKTESQRQAPVLRSILKASKEPSVMQQTSSGESVGSSKPTFAAVVKGAAKTPCHKGIPVQKTAVGISKLVEDFHSGRALYSPPNMKRPGPTERFGNTHSSESNDKRTAMQRLASKVMSILRRGIKRPPVLDTIETCDCTVEKGSGERAPPRAVPNHQVKNVVCEQPRVTVPTATFVHGRRTNVQDQKQHDGATSIESQKTTRESMRSVDEVRTARLSPHSIRLSKCAKPMQAALKQKYSKEEYLMPNVPRRTWVTAQSTTDAQCHLLVVPLAVRTQKSLPVRRLAGRKKNAWTKPVSFYFPSTIEENTSRIHRRYGHLSLTDEMSSRKTLPRECERCNKRRRKPVKPVAGRRHQPPFSPATAARRSEPYEESPPERHMPPHMDAVNQWEDEFKSKNTNPPMLFIHNYHWAIRMVFVALDLKEGRMGCRTTTIVS